MLACVSRRLLGGNRVEGGRAHCVEIRHLTNINNWLSQWLPGIRWNPLEHKSGTGFMWLPVMRWNTSSKPADDGKYSMGKSCVTKRLTSITLRCTPIIMLTCVAPSGLLHVYQVHDADTSQASLKHPSSRVFNVDGVPAWGVQPLLHSHKAMMAPSARVLQYQWQ